MSDECRVQQEWWVVEYNFRDVNFFHQKWSFWRMTRTEAINECMRLLNTNNEEIRNYISKNLSYPADCPRMNIPVGISIQRVVITLIGNVAALVASY